MRARLRAKRATKDYDVFVCYNRADATQVRQVYDALCERGLLPWLDAEDLLPGQRWQREIECQLRSARAIAVFFGPRGLGPVQELEQMAALHASGALPDRPLIPVILTSCESDPELPLLLKARQICDLRQASPDPIERLVAGISRELPRER